MTMIVEEFDDHKTLVLPDIGLSGKVLTEQAVQLTYSVEKQADGIVAGIVTSPMAGIVQLTMENAVKLRDALNESIEANS